jgi:uncharacterized protein
MFPGHQKRLLALDGGGIMGVVSLQILKRIEDQLRPLSGRGSHFVLSDFFDYFAGTSTGAIIATGLAMGKTVDELMAFYDSAGPSMFKPAPWHARLWHRYNERPLEAKLREVIGEATILEMQASGALKRLLLIVTRNAGTDSPWPLSTNPAARYNDAGRADCNLRVPLWQVVRASTAAPTYFRPQIIRFGATARAFVDGGITPHNNPALLLFKKAVMPHYRLGWPTGEASLMLVSIGTGFTTGTQPVVKTQRRTALGAAIAVPGELMRGIQQENDTNCRILGRCVHGPAIDREVGDLVAPQPLTHDLGRAFLYARYDADISPAGLAQKGLGEIDPAGLTMDNVAATGDLKRIGSAAADAVDMRRHFGPFMGWLARGGAVNLAGGS